MNLIKITTATIPDGSTTYYAHWATSFTTLDTGRNVNTKMKTLAGNTFTTDTPWDESDTRIFGFTKSNNAPASGTTTQIISVDGQTPVYAWFDNNTIYYYTEAEYIFLNADSSYLFNKMSYINNIDLTDFNSSNLTNASSMFNSCINLASLDISSLNTSNVTNMSSMFSNCYSFTTLDLKHFDTSKVQNMSSMFASGLSLQNVDMSTWNTSSLTDISGMFDGCNSIQMIDLSNFNTSNINSVNNTFKGCSNLVVLKLNNWDFRQMNTNSLMMNMTSGGFSSLRSLELNNTKFASNMTYAFGGLSTVQSLSLNNADTSEVINMQAMFNGDSSLTTLDLTSFNTENVIYMNAMFGSMTNLTTITVSDGFVVDQVTSSGGMFSGDTRLVGGNGTAYDSNHIDKEYAHYDYGLSNPGYFNERPTDCKDFETASWDTIANNIEKDPTTYPVGCIKKVELGNGLEDHIVRVANNTSPSECNNSEFSQTACGFVLEFTDVVTEGRMNYSDNIGRINGDGNKGSWEHSEMREYLNTIFYNALPSDLKSKVINTKVVTGYGSNDDHEFTTTDKLYLLSSMEVYRNISEQTTKTRQLDYYYDNGVTTSDNWDYTYKKYKYNSSSLDGPYNWWLRDPYPTSYFNFYISQGPGLSSANSSWDDTGISPAFKIGSNSNSKYTVTFNPNGGEVNQVTRKINQGESIGDLPEPVRNDYTFDGWWTSINDGTRVNKNFIPSSDTTIYAHWAYDLDCNNFETDSWDTIVSNIDQNPTTYPIGCTKEVDLGTYGTHTVRIANNTTPAACNGTDFSQTGCGFVLEFTDIITAHNINPEFKNNYIDGDGNKGGWKYSRIREFINNDIYNSLPQSLRKNIIPTETISGPGGYDQVSYHTTTDKLYLLSVAEIYGNNSGFDTIENKSRQFDYYSKYNITVNNCNTISKKYNGTNYYWWTRTPSNSGYYGLSQFVTISTGGSPLQTMAKEELGVSPAFRIKTNTNTKYTVSFNSNGGTVENDVIEITRGDSIGTLPTPERGYFTFDGWYTGLTDGTLIDQNFIPTEDTTIYAHWTENVKYTVTFNANGGTVSPTEKYMYGDESISDFPTPMRDGYVFDNWYTGMTDGTIVTSLYNVDEDKTLYAHWKPIYTVTLNTNGGDVFPSSKQITDGSRIFDLPDATKADSVFAGWWTEPTGGIKVDYTYRVYDNITLYARWGACNGFANASWSTIQSNIQNNPSIYYVGCKKDVDIANYGTHKVRVANNTTPSECSNTGFSQTACGFVLEFDDVIISTPINNNYYDGSQVGEGNVGGWENCLIRKNTIGNIYNGLPEDLKSIIIDTTVVSGHGSNDSSNFTTTDKLYLLSSKEIWNSTNDSAQNYHRQLDYYSFKETTSTNYKAASKKQGINFTQSWWTRTATQNDAKTFNAVGSDGHGYITTPNYYGVSPAFRIG